MPRILLSSLNCPSAQYFSTYSHKQYDLQETLLNIKCVFRILYNFCPKQFSFQEEMSEILLQKCTGLHVKYRYSFQILMKLEFSGQIFELYSNTKLYDNPLVGPELFYADGRTERQAGRQTDRRTDRETDMTKLMVTFQNFANAPKIPFNIIILSKWSLPLRFPHQNPV
jgi:hypothetical protein